MQQCTDRVQSSGECKHEPIQQCFRAFDILFKLVIQSRRLYERAGLINAEEDDFRPYVHALFATFNKVVSLSSDSLVTTQVILLRHIYTVVEQLSGVLSRAEAAKLLASLIDSLPKEPHPLIATARMNLVLTTVRGPLFSEAAPARAILLGTICRQLRFHLSQALVIPLCTESLGHMMNFYRAMSMADETSQVRLIFSGFAHLRNVKEPIFVCKLQFKRKKFTYFGLVFLWLLQDNVWYRDVETVSLATLIGLIQAVQMAQRTDSNVVS